MYVVCLVWMNYEKIGIASSIWYSNCDPLCHTVLTITEERQRKKRINAVSIVRSTFFLTFFSLPLFYSYYFFYFFFCFQKFFLFLFFHPVYWCRTIVVVIVGDFICAWLNKLFCNDRQTDIKTYRRTVAWHL